MLRAASISKACLVLGSLLAFCGFQNHAQANSKYAGIVYDVKGQKVIYAENAHSYRFPASLTKIMTLYVLFEELEAGQLNMNSKMKVSRRAAGQPPSRIGLRAGSSIEVKHAIKALITKSANDVASVVAEHISGTEYRFARRMTKTARKLGMTRTSFRNASGLPDWRQRTTANDMVKMGIALQKDFPQYYHHFSARTFRYGKRVYHNHNRLLGQVRGVDGIKTGYTRASGYNLVTSVRKGNRHIVAVVLGGRSGSSRDRHMRNLIARYLPKAVSGTHIAHLGQNAIPNVKPSTLAKYAKRTKTENRRQSVAVASASQTSEEGGADFSSIEDLIEYDEQQNGVDQARLRNGESVIEEGSQEADDSMVTASISPAAWQIQIAAPNDRQTAEKYLTQAKSLASTALADVKSMSIPVTSQGKSFYRARFSGFKDKREAFNACIKLKAHSLECFIVYE